MMRQLTTYIDQSMVMCLFMKTCVFIVTYSRTSKLLQITVTCTKTDDDITKSSVNCYDVLNV